jgi:predicted glycosyltransferase
MASAFFYVQHLLGIGHLARASRIAKALVADSWDITLAMGGMPVPGFAVSGARTMALPPVRAGAAGFAALVDGQGRAVDDALKARRRDELLAAFGTSKADVLIVEAFPFARRQMRFELLPLLEAARARRPKPLIVSSIRDILQESRKPGRSEEAIDAVETYFDLVLVHGDPSFAKLEDTFPLAGRIASKIAYTGLVAPPPIPAKQSFDVLVSAGGGAAGGRILLAAAQAMPRTTLAQAKWCFITGPNLASKTAHQLLSAVPATAELHEFRQDFPSLLAGAKLSISQAGYNTVCDLLRARCRAVLVPFAEGGETEQMARAARLAERGLATIVAEDRLSAETLAAAVATALAAPVPVHGLNLEGATATARLLREKCA